MRPVRSYSSLSAHRFGNRPSFVRGFPLCERCRPPMPCAFQQPLCPLIAGICIEQLRTVSRCAWCTYKSIPQSLLLLVTGPPITGGFGFSTTCFIARCDSCSCPRAQPLVSHARGAYCRNAALSILRASSRLAVSALCCWHFRCV